MKMQLLVRLQYLLTKTQNYSSPGIFHKIPSRLRYKDSVNIAIMQMYI